MKRHLLCIILLALAVGPRSLPRSSSAQETGWRVENVRTLYDLLPLLTDSPPQHHFLAADGRHVLFARGGDEDTVCSVDLVTAAFGCVSVPPELSRLRVGLTFTPASLSDDGVQAALVGEVWRTYNDTDLSVAHFADGTLEVLSQDNFADDLFFEQTSEPVWVEAQPAWSPDGTQLAVERTHIGVDGEAEPSQIAVFDLATGEARELTAIPGVGWEHDMGSILGIDWAPDASALVFSVRHVELDPLFDGIWTVDAAGDSLPERLVTVPQAEEVLAKLYPEHNGFFAATSISWSPDGERVLFWAGNPGAYVGYLWAFWVELATGAITPVPLPASELDRGDFRARWPNNAVWSPDGSALLVAARDEDTQDLDQAPMLLGERAGRMFSLWIVDVATGEPTLLGLLPFQPADLYAAAWGPEGDVIIAGYSFKLGRE